MTEATFPALPRSLVLIGMMGAGKSAIGRRIAARLGLEFIDADKEVEAAAGCSIQDIFDTYGEAAFRDVERRVIARQLAEPVHVLSTGGGAFNESGDPRADRRTRHLAVACAPISTCGATHARRNDGHC